MALFWSSLVESFNKIDDNIDEIGSKCWNAITGKDKYDEAQKKYTELSIKWQETKDEHKKYVQNISIEIEEVISNINLHKEILIERDFNRFINATSRIAMWEIICDKLYEEFKNQYWEMEKIKSRKSVFLIDFDNHPFKSYAFAFLSLGFFTRKMAKETFLKVKEQEEAFNHEKEKIKAEKIRLNQLLESLKNIDIYFRILTKHYNELLFELEYCINLLSVSYYLVRPDHKGDKIDCYFLPESHLNRLMLSDKLTRILNEMTNRRYLGSCGELMQKDVDDVKILVSGDERISKMVA